MDGVPKFWAFHATAARVRGGCARIRTHTSNRHLDVNQNDATPLAAANYDLAAYDRIAFSFPSLKDVPGSTVRAMSHAQYGGKYMWLNGGGFGFYTVAHELGHTYGLRHANR